VNVDFYKILLDIPSPDPALGFKQYAHALKGIIEDSDAQFAVGIFGKWGSGKTTLMRHIESVLDRERTIPIQFVAWRYEKEEHLIIPLLDTLREGLTRWADDHQDRRDVAIKTASTVGKVMTSIIAGFGVKAGIQNALELSFDANRSLSKWEQFKREEEDARVSRSPYHASFRALQETFEEFARANPERRIVVFVDDLDRCLPKGALQVLESMKLFFDFKGFVFVVGLDQSIVEWYVDAELRRDYPTDSTQVAQSPRGADYVKKIIQVPFALQPVSLGQVEDFLTSFINDAKLPLDQQAELRETVRPHLDILLQQTGVNPRDIKRFVNTYTLSRKIWPNLDKNVILAVQTIGLQRDWSTVNRALIANPEEFVSALRDRVNGDASTLSTLFEDPTLTDVPATFLDYVRNPPGNALLQIGLDGHSVAEYIYAGAATTGRLNTHILNTFKAVRKLIPLVRNVMATVNDPNSPAMGALAQAVQSISVTSIDLSSGPDATLLTSDLQELAKRMDTIPTTPDTITSWGQELEALIRRIIRTLGNLLYQAIPAA
jgi:hypothetical protein